MAAKCHECNRLLPIGAMALASDRTVVGLDGSARHETRYTCDDCAAPAAPEIFYCVESCGYETQDWDELMEHAYEHQDGAPCCMDPGCGGNPCTFPGYADNH